LTYIMCLYDMTWYLYVCKHIYLYLYIYIYIWEEAPGMVAPAPHGGTGGLLGLHGRSKRLQEGPRVIPTTSFRLQEVSRALQEALKRLSEGFCVEDAMGNPF